MWFSSPSVDATASGDYESASEHAKRVETKISFFDSIIHVATPKTPLSPEYPSKPVIDGKDRHYFFAVNDSPSMRDDLMASTSVRITPPSEIITDGNSSRKRASRVNNIFRKSLHTNNNSKPPIRSSNRISWRDSFNSGHESIPRPIHLSQHVYDLSAIENDLPEPNTIKRYLSRALSAILPVDADTDAIPENDEEEDEEEANEPELGSHSYAHSHSHSHSRSRSRSHSHDRDEESQVEEEAEQEASPDNRRSLARTRSSRWLSWSAIRHSLHLPLDKDPVKKTTVEEAEILKLEDLGSLVTPHDGVVHDHIEDHLSSTAKAHLSVASLRSIQSLHRVKSAMNHRPLPKIPRLLISPTLSEDIGGTSVRSFQLDSARQAASPASQVSAFAFTPKVEKKLSKRAVSFAPLDDVYEGGAHYRTKSEMNLVSVSDMTETIAEEPVESEEVVPPFSEIKEEAIKVHVEPQSRAAFLDALHSSYRVHFINKVTTIAPIQYMFEEFSEIAYHWDTVEATVEQVPFLTNDQVPANSNCPTIAISVLLPHMNVLLVDCHEIEDPQDKSTSLKKKQLRLTVTAFRQYHPDDPSVTYVNTQYFGEFLIEGYRPDSEERQTKVGGSGSFPAMDMLYEDQYAAVGQSDLANYEVEYEPHIYHQYNKYTGLLVVYVAHMQLEEEFATTISQSRSQLSALSRFQDRNAQYVAAKKEQEENENIH